LSVPNPEQLFLANLEVIDEIVGFLSFRHRLSADEREELSAGVRLKLIENDYAALRNFGGRSSLRTYLTAVVYRYFLDRRIERWGKWRPAVEARRNGPVAVLLDRLLSREGLSFQEAVETLRTNHGVPDSIEALERMRSLLPQRQPRRFVGEDHLSDVAREGPVEDALIRKLDHEAHGDRVQRALSAALGQCRADDRLLLKLRFQDGLTVARIARLLDVDQKPLYRRLEAIITNLRRHLEQHGIDKGWVADYLSDPTAKSAPASVPLIENGLNRAPYGRRPDHV
jgi:RNA polymerase sigma factor (sigma-70 family)